jgi:hypothetical protein
LGIASPAKIGKGHPVNTREKLYRLIEIDQNPLLKIEVCTMEIGRVDYCENCRRKTHEGTKPKVEVEE